MPEFSTDCAARQETPVLSPSLNAQRPQLALPLTIQHQLQSLHSSQTAGTCGVNRPRFPNHPATLPSVPRGIRLPNQRNPVISRKKLPFLIRADVPVLNTVLGYFLSLVESEVTSVVSDSLQPMDSSIHGILQARTLEWVAISFSRAPSGPRDWTWFSRIAGRLFTVWTTKELLITC